MGQLKGQKPRQWVDGSTVDFDNWGEDPPVEYEGLESCARINFLDSSTQKSGYWYSNPCNNHFKGICQKPAIPGHDPKPTEFPTIAPNPNCEADWFYMESSGNCYHIDHTMVSSFDAAEAKCVGSGGHLASVNSPEMQAELRIHLNDPSAIGKSHIRMYEFIIKYQTALKLTLEKGFYQ